jgi:predicted metal-dependent RNase
MSAKAEGAWQVRTNGVVVFVPKYGIEGPVYLTEKARDASMQVCPAVLMSDEPSTRFLQVTRSESHTTLL